MSWKRIVVIGLFLLLAWIATGVYVVDLDQVGLVRRFGKLQSQPKLPGLYLDLPWPFLKVDCIRTDETKQVRIGFSPADEKIFVETSQELLSEFFTGDQNLIHIQAASQYCITNPAEYYLAHENPDVLITAGMQSAIAEILATRNVDYILTTGRAEVQQHIRTRTQQLADRYHLGISMISVDLSSVRPPTMVEDAFRDVTDARSDKERMIHDAQSTQARLAELTIGDKQRITTDAEIYRADQITSAKGNAEYFTAMIDRLDRIEDPHTREQARAMTMYRLWNETLTRVLPKLKRSMYIDPSDKIDLQLIEED